ncbi:MAG: DUF3370 domain-containing protein [Scytolyngbya sp. HA4215-MV1]|jgi:hypothetical protein|nr:DUF3370 domain-containing protein [Scytolyngbya sp. HA4215-MV1]
MLSLLPLFPFVQTPLLPAQLTAQHATVAQQIIQSHEIRALPGQLDKTPVFNSNSPEVVETEGILLSTFPPAGKRVPEAHLDFPLQHRFDLFSHHISRTRQSNDFHPLYIGVIVYNPGTELVTLDVLQAASYLSRPDAPFIDLPSYVANPLGTVFSGPGSRVVGDILRGQRQDGWLDRLLIPPGESRMLMSLPIPARDPAMRSHRLSGEQSQRKSENGLLARRIKPARNGNREMPEVVPQRPLPPSSNGRTTLMHLNSSGPVYLASLAMFARQTPSGTDRIPTLQEWQDLLVNGGLAGPRDLAPTSLEKSVGSIIYGRVAGISQGTLWQGRIADNPKAKQLKIPQPGQSISYGISTVTYGTLGTGQVQSAPMLARYPDTAYLAHGNYGVHYDLSIPLYNAAKEPRTVAISLQTPLKDEDLNGALAFLIPPDRPIFFRGTIRLRYKDDFGLPQTRYFHVVQRRGQMGEPLIRLNLPPGDRRLVELDFIYPPDSTPPQVITIQTLEPPPAIADSTKS